MAIGAGLAYFPPVFFAAVSGWPVPHETLDAAAVVGFGVISPGPSC